MTLRDNPTPRLVRRLRTQRPSLFERAEAAIRGSKSLVIQTKALLTQSRAILGRGGEQGKCFVCGSSPV
jgi:hypothetical protein